MMIMVNVRLVICVRRVIERERERSIKVTDVKSQLRPAVAVSLRHTSLSRLSSVRLLRVESQDCVEECVDVVF